MARDIGARGTRRSPDVAPARLFFTSAVPQGCVRCAAFASGRRRHPSGTPAGLSISLGEAGEFERLLVADGFAGGWCLGSEGGEVLTGEFAFGAGFGKFGEEALVEVDGLLLAILLAVDFGEAEQGGGGEGALVAEAGEQILVLSGGGGRVAGDLLGAEGVAEEFAEVAVLGGEGGGEEEKKEQPFHGSMEARGSVGIVMDWS
jgi:hypothetical protein